MAWKEPFAPILPVIRVKDIDQAVELANRSEYGLQSSVFTNDINRAFSIAERLEVGTVQINNKTERGPDHFPVPGRQGQRHGDAGRAVFHRSDDPSEGDHREPAGRFLKWVV